jgi:hypothetical protein
MILYMERLGNGDADGRVILRQSGDINGIELIEVEV